MAARRRTKRAYAHLFDNPTALSAGGPSDKGAHVTLYPNGAREIWIRDTHGLHGIRLTVSHGPAGLGVTLSTMAGTAPITLHLTSAETNEIVSVDTREVETCQYDATPSAQALQALVR